MKKFKVYYGITKEVMFEGTNEEYVRDCELQGFETSGDIEQDYYDNNFLFGDTGDCELEEVEQIRDFKNESINLIKDRVGNWEVVEISHDECEELTRVEDSTTLSEDLRISIEPLMQENQDDYDYNHFYAYDLEKDEVIGYFKVNYFKR